MKKFWSEFKKFISRGSVMDLAVGTIIGSAFTAIVTALSNGILKPLINTAIYYLIPGEGLDSMYTFLVKKYEIDADTQQIVVDATGEQVIDLAKSIYIDWGAFIAAIINFILIAFVLFLIIRAFNRVKDAEANAKDVAKRAQLKQEKGLKLTKKEAAALEAVAASEAKKKAEEEEAARKASEPTPTEALLSEIRDLLKNQK